jgi:hypothetical protein
MRIDRQMKNGCVGTRNRLAGPAFLATDFAPQEDGCRYLFCRRTRTWLVTTISIRPESNVAFAMRASNVALRGDLREERIEFDDALLADTTGCVAGDAAPR